MRLAALSILLVLSIVSGKQHVRRNEESTQLWNGTVIDCYGGGSGGNGGGGGSGGGSGGRGGGCRH